MLCLPGKCIMPCGFLPSFQLTLITHVTHQCILPRGSPLVPLLSNNTSSLRTATTAAFLPGWDLWRDAGVDFSPLYTEIYEPESPENQQEVLDLLDKVLFLREGGFSSACKEASMWALGHVLDALAPADTHMNGCCLSSLNRRLPSD